jgi:hypothetical protein
MAIGEYQQGVFIQYAFAYQIFYFIPGLFFDPLVIVFLPLPYYFCNQAGSAMLRKN